MRALAALGATTLILSVACSRHEGDVPFGFTPSSARVQSTLERRVIERADPARVRDVHRELTRLPHPAASARDRELADYVARQFSVSGLQDVRIVTHEVLLPRAAEIRVEMTAPRAWHATLREDTAGVDAAYHAFSASGEVEAPIVYAGPGAPADYEWLSRNGIDVKGRIVLVHSSGPYRYRGLAAFTAQQTGAAAILTFASHDDAGPSDAESRRGIERGSILYDFFYPGDPQTPGWASSAGVKRLPSTEAKTLPRVISVPLSTADAESILATLQGPSAPSWWGKNASRWRVGGDGGRLRVKVAMNNAVRPIWTVTGVVEGEDPDEVVIVGNHRDAWVFGGVDPATGTAAMLETARLVGSLKRDGWRPKRSLLFASWDAEELGLTSSTEWAEQNAAWVRQRAVAYLNVDSAASGGRFVAGASPSLVKTLADAADAVPDPSAKGSVRAVERSRAEQDRGTESRHSNKEVVDDRLGGGSDYSVFLNHLGVPSADVAFDGPYPTYHTAFDTHEYVQRHADPAFAATTASARLLAIAALRLAAADVLPLDAGAIATSASAFVDEIRSRTSGTDAATALRPVDAALQEFARAAQSFESGRRAALDSGDLPAIASLNRRLLQLERSFVDDTGLPGREWYRHVLMAPARSYQPVVLPGLAEALESSNSSQFQAQSARLAVALRRAAAVLEGR